MYSAEDGRLLRIHTIADVSDFITNTEEKKMNRLPLFFCLIVSIISNMQIYIHHCHQKRRG